MFPSRRVDDETGRAQHREVLAHVRHLAADPRRQLAHGGLAVGEGLEDAQALGVAEGTRDGGGALSLVLGGCDRCRSRAQCLTSCARTQVVRRMSWAQMCPVEGISRGVVAAYSRAMTDNPVTLAAIRETRAMLRGRVHHTPMLSSATAARVAGAAARGAARGRAAVPQGGAPPEDRLVQAAGGAGADLVAHARGAPPRRDHDLGRQRGPGVRLGRARGGRAGHGRDAGGRGRVQGGGVPRVRRRRRAPRRARRRVAGAPREAPRGARPDARPPVRRPRGAARATGRAAWRSSRTCRTWTSS